MRILNVTVHQVGISTDGRNQVVARGRDVMTGWRFTFVVPAAQRDHVLGEVRAGRRPMIPIPEAELLPWASVSGVNWE